MLLRRVVGKSMLPTLRPGQIVIARQRFTYIKPGDVVVLQHDGIEKIKRVTSIDGSKVLVEGDNPQASTDSRHFGSVPRQAIVGKVLFVRSRPTVRRTQT